MDKQLKQRLVGVAVIFALAVIFIPLLLDGSGRRHEDLSVTIPPRPHISSNIRVEEKVIELKNELKQVPVLEPVIIDEVNSPPRSDKAKESKVIEREKESTAIETGSRTAEKSVSKNPAKPLVGGDSWVIQVGSFNDKQKAYQLRDRLRKSKLSSVFIEQYQHQGSTRYRVRMGPFIQQKKATVVQNKVLAKYSINGLVMRYEK